MATNSIFNKWINKRCPRGKQITLNGKNIFILPTIAGMAFIFLLLVILLVGINYQNNLAYGLCFMLGSILFFSIIHTYRNLLSLSLINAGATAVFVDDIVNFNIKLELNKGYKKQAIGIYWLDNINNTSEFIQLMDVDKINNIEFLLGKKAIKRGYFYPGSLRVQTVFPLGFFIAWANIDLLLNTIVYPKPIEGEIAIANYAGDGEEGLYSAGRGVDDFQGLRAYQVGDSMRLINWKSFSKGQGVFVKDFTALEGKDILLDFDRVVGDLEYRLSVLCFWVLKLAEQQQHYGLKLPNIELSPDHGERHKQASLLALAMYGPTR